MAMCEFLYIASKGVAGHGRAIVNAGNSPIAAVRASKNSAKKLVNHLGNLRFQPHSVDELAQKSINGYGMLYNTERPNAISGAKRRKALWTIGAMRCRSQATMEPM